MDVECDKCGDVSNSRPNLKCGRVEESAWVGPCDGVYRSMLTLF